MFGLVLGERHQSKTSMDKHFWHCNIKISFCGKNKKMFSEDKQLFICSDRVIQILLTLDGSSGFREFDMCATQWSVCDITAHTGDLSAHRPLSQ